MCKDCGFYYAEDGADKCHILKKTVDPTECSECQTFIVRQYDGSEPFTPAEHEWLFKDALEKKKMNTNIKGLRF